MKTLNLYPQKSWHSDGKIIGTVDALMELQKAINTALTTNHRMINIEMFASDGEEYTLQVIRLSEEEMDNEKPFYYSLYR